jgi:hypothetical protein
MNSKILLGLIVSAHRACLSTRIGLEMDLSFQEGWKVAAGEDARCQMLDARCWMLDAGCWKENARKSESTRLSSI